MNRRSADEASAVRLEARTGLRAILILAVSLTLQSFGAPLQGRGLAQPLTQHPGNIFVAGEEVTVPLPKGNARWRLADYEGRSLTEPELRDGAAALGRLPVGFYRLEQMDGSQWVSLGVLEPLRVPTPASSPIAMDVAMAWFYPKEKMDAVANLCALAGVNWVRDRLYWGEMEPKRGEFSAANKYDASAAAQSRAGLRVLQVIHASPSWANKNGKRFPTDMRDAFRFFEAMARRWRGQVLAFEPWNEADIPMFGGHTGAEMAAMQKAAYLGLKAGNPEIIACLNVFALHRTNQLADLNDNEAWPYFETYNLHHYEPFDRYPKLYADHRAVSAGRPLWVSECAVPVKWAGDEKLKEPTDADLRVQAERVAKTCACSLHEGSRATFYFLLPHYVEGQTQFGIVRPDLTPRPAYVALAAVGRLLADAKPLGAVKSDGADVRAFLFRAKPDGRDSDVLVAWTTNREATLKLPVAPRAGFDHLGRAQAVTSELKLTMAPQFAIFPSRGARKLPLIPPPATPPVRRGKPSPVVLQALWPETELDLNLSAYRIPSHGAVRVPVFAYNFGDKVAEGRLGLEAPTGWMIEPDAPLQLAPGERKELALVRAAAARGTNLVQARIAGAFGRAGQPVLSVRMTPDQAGR